LALVSQVDEMISLLDTLILQVVEMIDAVLS
jgi:hypothetical protein